MGASSYRRLSHVAGFKTCSALTRRADMRIRPVLRADPVRRDPVSILKVF